SAPCGYVALPPTTDFVDKRFNWPCAQRKPSPNVTSVNASPCKKTHVPCVMLLAVSTKPSAETFVSPVPARLPPEPLEVRQPCCEPGALLFAHGHGTGLP